MKLLLAMMDLRIWRAGSRLARTLRIVAASLMLLGLAPAPDEMVDWMSNGVHETSPVVAIVSDESCCADECRNSGCTAFQHHCGCCARIAAALPQPHRPPDVEWILATASSPGRAGHDRDGPHRATSPSVRPPIG